MSITHTGTGWTTAERTSHVVVADRDTDTIELVICYGTEAPYEELSGPWRVDEN